MTNCINPPITIPRPQRDEKPWSWIVVNSSGGKDSQTALRVVVDACDRQSIPRDRIVVSHQCLGESEWAGTLDLVRRQADQYGLRLEVSKYCDKTGRELSLLDYVRARGKWPDNKNRFCTSEFKRGPGGKVLVKLFRESPGPILNVYGFRAEESPARSKKRVFALNERFSTMKREVSDWLPIFGMTSAEVWADIAESGVPSHPAYAQGMSRLSCCFCVLAPRNALLIAGRANPELLDAYCQTETEIGHTFQNGKSIHSIRDAIRAGEQPTNLADTWRM